jgi:hypothetical protein
VTPSEIYDKVQADLRRNTEYQRVVNRGFGKEPCAECEARKARPKVGLRLPLIAFVVLAAIFSATTLAMDHGFRVTGLTLCVIALLGFSWWLIRQPIHGEGQ